MVVCRVKECGKIVGLWVMKCNKMDGPKTMEFEKVFDPKVKKHANSL